MIRLTKNIAYTLQDNEADGPNYRQKWEGEIARDKHVPSQFKPLGENRAFLVDGYVAGGAVFVVRQLEPLGRKGAS